MSTETKLFLRKTKELSRLVSAMKELEISRELETELLEIGKKLADLSIVVEKDKCLNAGGKFEWVDSVLVKCLRNGTWLLLDQVNLCSPAILDRLNGLLEPNGALTIGEKGVDEDGNVFTVKAHGNFRLFLTMDPRHGEISRAMRNRGVEISIPAPRHSVPSNSLDVTSLLNSCGIRSVNRQKLLLKVHGAIVDQYKLNEMLQVASFTSQQTSKGFAFEQSLRNSYRELCGSLDARSKHEALRKIDETLSEVVRDETPESFYDLDAMSLRTRNLRRNARLAIVEQQGFLLKLSLEKLLCIDDTGAQKIDFHDFFDRPPITDTMAFFGQLLLDFYERSSLDDLHTRRLWSRNILPRNKFNKLAEMNECLSNEVGNMEFLFRGKSAFEVPLNLTEPPTFSNNLVIALYFRLTNLDCESERDLHKDKDVMYLKEYSSAVCSGKISTNLKNEPLILGFAEMADQFGRVIETILRSQNLSINDREYVELRDGLKWYQRFQQMGKTELIDKSRGVFLDVREISSHLKVHYKWLTKFIKKLLALSRDSGARLESSDFSEKYLNVAIDADKYRKIRKKIKKLLFVPSPHISESSMIFHERLRSISRKLEIIEEDLIDSLRTKLKVVSVSSPDNLIVRKNLIEICVKSFENVVEDTTRLEEMSGDVSKIEEINSKREVETSEDFVEIEIWPIYEFFFFLFAYRFQRRFCDEFSDDFKEEMRRNFEKNFDKGNQTSDENLVDCHAETAGESFGRIYKESVFGKFENVPTIPPRLIGLMKALNANEISTRRRITLLPELLFSVEEFAERSFAVKNSNILLHWYDNEEDGTEENFNIFQTNFVNKSSLCDLIFELFLTSGSRKEMINFGNYKNQRRLLQTVQTLLWRNSLILNSDEFDISTNDSILLQFLVDYYLSVTNKVTDTFPLKLNTEEQNNLENRFFKPIRLLREIKGKLESENNAIERGNGWLILGYLQIFLFHDLGPIDPVQKIALKSKYIQENISELEHLMRVEDLQSVILGTSLSKERKASRINHLRTLSSEARSFENIRAVRPSSSFQNLREEIENFSSNVGSFESIFKQIGQLNQLAEQHREEGSQAPYREKLHEAIIWKKSLERFSGKLEKNFLVGFPDLVSPVISAVSNLHHGLSILIHELSNREFRNSNSDVCYNLLRFPVVGSCQENYINLAKLCSSEKLIFILTKQLKSKTVQKDRFTMIKIALKELENLSLVRNDVKSLWEELNGIFFKIRILWKEQEKQKEEQMKEKESLFKMKSTKEEEESDFKNMFPSYQQDFLELEEVFPDSHRDLSEIRKIAENISSDEESFVEVISMKDARKIQEIHWNILRNCSPCDSNLKRSSTIVSRRSGNNLESSVSNLEPNFIDPLIQRLELLGSSVKTWPENSSSQLVCCLNVLISEKCNFHSGNNDREVYDFYKDPNIPEIEECQPLFDRLCEKISEFLKEWPENPILSSIKLIIDRLHSFSIDSSLSRFLVGVELLLTKIKQWEENARFDVSLAEFIEAFGEKVLRWRKLEISRWKDSLEVLEDDLKTWASKWWFFLFNLVDQYLAEDIEDIEDSSKSDDASKGKMIESLERFLVESSLIEFETRLGLVYLFYRHIDHLEETKRQKELLAIFWNIYFYYCQFLDDVQNKIKALKEPIAKKLKDTIKITRWNDISYWSVKNTAEKTRRTLHKFVKEFRKGLEQNVASYLTLKTKVMESLETSSRRELRPSDFLVSLESRKLQKTEKLADKARQFCENIIERSGYSEIRRDIETFVEESLEESKRLRSLEVDKTLAKSKQQTQLKSLLQQKKLALANYFKALTGLGVSYRIGVLTWKNRKSEITNFTSVPLDLQEMQNFEFKSKYVNIDKGLFEQWSGCNKYYYESLVKLNFLDGILNSGKGDLDMQNAERCHGFSVHLALLAHRQKETIANFFKRFLPFRIQVSNLALMIEDIIKNTSNDTPDNTTKITKSAKLDVPVRRNLQTAMNNLQELLEVLQMSMKQIVIFLESCPTDSLAQENLLDLNETAVPVLRESNVPKASITSMKDSSNLIKNMAIKLNSWITVSRKIEKSGQVFLFHQKHVDFLQLSYQEINEVKKKLVDLRCSFTLDHPISKNLNFLIEKIESSNELFTSTIEQSAESGDSSEYKVKLDKLVTQILLVVQRKLQDSQKLIEERNDVEKESSGSFEENLMTERLIEPLKKVVPNLRLNTISKILGELLQIIHECDVKSANDCIRSLSQHIPLLEQYTLFLHYYLHEQVASFRLTCKFLYLQLNVFLDLATNGFCQPENLDTPEDDQEGGGTAEGGMGLADGEGQKDVSERIETEDQLEEARNPNEEEKDNERKDVEENEKGIEMSENFESHMQDLEQREKEENDEEDDDLDKEMGETDETAEKLDEEIWKDEEEEEEENDDKNENKGNEKEERGTGEKTEQEELSAKDTDENKSKDENEEREADGEKKENERKEINEFEEPEVNEDQVDPYHGQNQQEIEPESFELPEDVNLDEEAKEDNLEGDEENPFDIDQMKESTIPEEKEDGSENKEEPEEDKQRDSSDEDVNEEKEEGEENGNIDADKRRDEKVTDPEKDKENDTEQENIEEENRTEEDKAPPSFDAGSKEIDASQEVESRKDGSRDAVESQSNEEQMEIDPTENSTDDKRDKGTGQSQTEEREGHSGSKQEENVPISGKERSSKPVQKRREPGESDENRSLLDSETRPLAKKLKTTAMQDLDSQEERERDEEGVGGESETYEHIKNAENYDDYVFDAATEEQIKKQASNLEEDEKDQMDDQLEDNDIEMHEEPESKNEEEETKKEQSQKLSENKEDKSANARGEKSNDGVQIEIGGEVEGEMVETSRVLRGNESTIHTKLSELECNDLPVDIAQRRSEIESMLSQWSRGPSSIEATNAWSSISALTESAARELSEKLRLVLEPTLTSRLKGDYRTGKRINMRKVIPYIASEFRKDKIWLRRTKPSKRDYQIVLAIDDSSSMADNRSKELAFESLSLIGKAMTYLEVGQLAVVNFGERVNVLHPFGENFTEESGARLIQEMKFDQRKTMIGELLDFAIEMFACQGHSSDNAKLVTILSDGRGIFSEGTERVTAAVRRAKLLNIFLVFIIVDNPLNKDSILDIRMPIFEDGRLLGIRSYMDNFPFPFYIILRDLDTLPVVLSDALRQWFEIVGRIDI